MLLPATLDDYVCSDSYVRVIDAFVASLDMADLGFRHSQLNDCGRPPYHPATLLKLYLYGYYNGIRSSRRLERESHRNVEVMWLLEALKPDFKTIASFRRQNGPSIRRMFQHFVRFCHRVDLIEGELIAIDGTLLSGVNSKERHYTPKKVQRELERVDLRIQEYLKAMDVHDQAESQAVSAESAKLAALEKRRRYYQGLQKQFHASGQSQMCTTDPQARRMSQPGKGSIVGFNVQSAVDHRYKLIAGYEVTNDNNEFNHLAPLAETVKIQLNRTRLTVVADTGYYSGWTVKECIDRNITPYISLKNTTYNAVSPGYEKRLFHYDPQSNAYRCPQNQWLTAKKTVRKRRLMWTIYTSQACRQCPERAQCTRNTEGRTIQRWVHQHLIEDMHQRVRQQPAIMKARKAMVEHPFGTLKRTLGMTFFLVKGLDHTSTEIGLAATAYNLKRAINLLGADELREKMA